MKKRLVLLLALTISLACLVASCGSKETKDDNNISHSQDVEEEEAPAEDSQENEGEPSEEGETAEQEGSSEEGEAAEPTESEETAVTSIDDIPWNDSEDAVSFVVRIKDSPKGWNPNVHGDDNLFLIAQNVYPRLCALDTTKSNLVGEAAQSWEFNQDATELTFHLRDGLTWTNGKPLTSEDVKYTFETIKNNRDYPFSVIMENVETVEAVDSQTVVFKLINPDGSFDKMLGWYGTFIMSHEALKDAPTWTLEIPWNEIVTCGPFVVRDVNDGVVTLTPNTIYPEPGKVDKLVFSVIPNDSDAVEALKNGEIDYLEDLPAEFISEIQSREDMALVDDFYPTPIRLVFNLESEHLEDEVLRKAIALCVDRDRIHKEVYGSSTMAPENTMYSSVVAWAVNTEDLAPDYNPEAAKNLLVENGYVEDENGNLFPEGILSIAVPENGSYAEIAEIIAGDLKGAGIPCTVDVYSYANWNAKVSQMDFTMEIESGFMGPDPAALAPRYGTGGGGNTGHYSNQEVDELLAKGQATGDVSKRAETYKAVQKILATELPAVPILGYSTKNVYNTAFKHMPCNGQGMWSWGDFSHVGKN